ncbi:NADH--cytochrome b5 reductase 1-like isoform X1 [Cucurbita moschata]|uniref:cytochrome-b5 reductase n=1 Tax=Cucurbita moschata TaxID=3662 RepID=A0A6J1FU08_CUCMO|nr:NADH--cytochrome b5 reductase 1-like isoform X1 [Cucurbita moschata]
MATSFVHSHRPEFLTVAVAAVAIGVATAYYFYITKKSKPQGCLDPDNFKEFKLVKRKQLSHNVAKFRFSLPTPTSILGLPIGQHMSCRGKDSEGEEVVKPYTPTSLDTDVGYFDLVIKMYPQGRMSHHFREMREGDFLAVKGPKGRFKYEANEVEAFGMLAGGTGITPMFQVARAILENPVDHTNVHLIYANATYEDILLKEELDSLASRFPSRFSVYYVLDQPPEGWDGGVGFVTEEMIRLHCPGPSPNVRVDIEVRTTPHEQSYGCLPQNYWLYFPNAVPVLIQPTPLFTLLFALLARSNSIFPSPSQKQLK